jgi:hypothetical protein
VQDKWEAQLKRARLLLGGISLEADTALESLNTKIRALEAKSSVSHTSCTLPNSNIWVLSLLQRRCAGNSRDSIAFTSRPHEVLAIDYGHMTTAVSNQTFFLQISRYSRHDRKTHKRVHHQNVDEAGEVGKADLVKGFEYAKTGTSR